MGRRGYIWEEDETCQPRAMEKRDYYSVHVQRPAALQFAVALASDYGGLFSQAISSAAAGTGTTAADVLQALREGAEKTCGEEDDSLPPAPYISELILDFLEDRQLSRVLNKTGVYARHVRDKVKRLTRTLDFNAYGRDLVEESCRLDPVIGRDEEIRRIIQILCRRNKNNPVLVGEAGVGKTALVEGLAQRIACGDVPSALAGSYVLALHSHALSHVVALARKFDEERGGGKVIVFIDHIHRVVDMNVANHLKAMLARGELQCIGATTVEQYSSEIEKDAAFERQFQQVFVAEPSIADTISILRGLKHKYAHHHKVRILDEALVAAAELSKRYVSGRRLPDMAIDLLDEACSLVQLQLHCRPEEIDRLERKRTQLAFELRTIDEEDGEESRARAQEISDKLGAVEKEMQELTNKYGKEKEETDKRIKDKDAVGFDQIAMVLSRWTGIPVTRPGQQEKVKLMGLSESLQRRIIGQDEAIDAIAKAVVRARVGLSRPQQPIGSFLFLGPTGVGKTELAKALAVQLFNDDNLIIRMDMSEYMEPQSVAKLIGAPPGYAGYHEGGQLTKAVRQKPYSIILFDEIEKAHVDVFNTLLQVLDDGRLTDNHGMTADFTNTLIIMTSNLGARHLCEAAAVDDPSSRRTARDWVMLEVRKHFRPEFLNRLDEIVIFNSLTRQQLREVAALQIGNVAQRLANKSITVVTSEAAVDFVLDQSYDPAYGARPMRRWVEKNMVTVLSNMMLREEIRSGSQVYIDAAEGGKGLLYSTKENCKQATASCVESDSSSLTADEYEVCKLFYTST